MIMFISISLSFLKLHYWQMFPFLLGTLWCRCINHTLKMCGT
jgi:hypothetical protein